MIQITNRESDDVDELAFPFEIEVEKHHSCIDPDTVVCKRVSSDDYALIIADGGECSDTAACTLEDVIAEKPHLLKMVVTGKKELTVNQKVKTAKRNNEMQDARDLFQEEDLKVVLVAYAHLCGLFF